MKPILTVRDKEYGYEVYYDECGYYDAFEAPHCMDFESEEAKQKMLSEYERGQWEFFMIVKRAVCPCCNSLKDDPVDSLHGIIAGDGEEALKEYMEYEGNVAGWQKVEA